MKTMKFFTASGERVKAYYGNSLDAVRMFGSKDATHRTRLGQYVIGYRPGTSGMNPEDCVPVARAILYDENGSKHICSSKCRCAKGGNCECSCGGEFHGVDAL